ncbi:hypothetical protein THAOC_23254 [Thalassiosira oceanica]|uniref:Uncharacterized protein n=1 Tax=Thalassiosira oceanica TaxID=159749 RepID=K0SDS3_THAOC|nr:hypothetical protein THAOC_23254 [Thalassiosira oceanica]|eukprot:EJK56787.1 hypothetical protein THAOC_23254 [Thalassiosira oceanica]
MDCAQFLLSSEEKVMARARGFTRYWYQLLDKKARLVSFTLDAKRALGEDKRALEEDDALPLIGEAHDDDWVIVDRNTDIPALPTNPRGCIEFTRLDLGQVELVSFDNWRDFLWTFEYGKDDATNATANKNARRTLLTRYLERQLHADRILTQSQLEYSRLQSNTDLEPFYATREEKQLARDQGFTRLWVWDRENDEKPYFVRDKSSIRAGHSILKTFALSKMLIARDYQSGLDFHFEAFAYPIAAGADAKTESELAGPTYPSDPDDVRTTVWRPALSILKTFALSGPSSDATAARFSSAVPGISSDELKSPERSQATTLAAIVVASRSPPSHQTGPLSPFSPALHFSSGEARFSFSWRPSS